MTRDKAAAENTSYCVPNSWGGFWGRRTPEMVSAVTRPLQVESSLCQGQ